MNLVFSEYYQNFTETDYSNDKMLSSDEFWANGEAALNLADLIHQVKAEALVE